MSQPHAQLVEAVQGGGLGALMTDLIIMVARDTPQSALEELKERVQGYHDDRIRGECFVYSSSNDF